MHTIMKIVGVTPDAIGRLHDVLNQPGMLTSRGHHLSDGAYDSTHNDGIVPYAFITDSTFHPENGTYTVKLRFNLVIKHHSSPFYPPLSALEKIFGAINQHLLPSASTIAATEQERIAEQARIVAHEELVERMANEFLGQKCQYDIINGRSGEIIAPANRKITRTLIRAIARNIADLNLADIPEGDTIINLLKQHRLEHKS